MGVEIEHKYLVKDDSYHDLAVEKFVIEQGYLCREPARTVRVRTKGTKGYLTVKGLTENASRLEFEYEIPYNDAEKLLGLCDGKIVRKLRYIVPYKGHIWEVDIFEGEDTGLRVAEIELPSPDTEYVLPPFVGENVTGDKRYYNSNL